MRADEVKSCAYELKISAYEVKIRAYEVKYWAPKSRHGCLDRFFRYSLWPKIRGQRFTSKIEVKISAYEVKS